MNLQTVKESGDFDEDKMRAQIRQFFDEQDGAQKLEELLNDLRDSNKRFVQCERVSPDKLREPMTF